MRLLEAKTPVVKRDFSPDLIALEEIPLGGPDNSLSGFAQSHSARTGGRPVTSAKSYRVGLLTGCVQDLIYSDVNRDTADALLANGCTVVTPPSQACCGSLHAHNGEYKMAKGYARRLIDHFDLDHLDAIITNAAGCGSHLKHFDHLLKDDPQYSKKAAQWSEKVKDISEFLVEIDFRAPEVAAAVPSGGTSPETRVTYHDACHLCHGQKITVQPRELLKKIPGLDLKPLAESMWCCGSAGIYNLIQPEMADKLLQRKLDHIAATGATVVATGNPGCLLQIQNGLKARGVKLEVVHPVTLLARGYRSER